MPHEQHVLTMRKGTVLLLLLWLWIPLHAQVESTAICLFGTAFPIDGMKLPRPQLSSCSAEAVAVFLDEVDGPRLDRITEQCLNQRKDKNLGDWATVLLTRELAGRCFAEQGNEAVALQYQMLSDMGYRVQLAKAGGRLCLLAAFQEDLYRYPYLVVEDTKYYIVDPELMNQPVLVFKQFPPKGRPLTMEVGRPELSFAPSEPKTLSLRDASKVTLQTNQNLLDYYACLPKCAHWASYAAVSLSDEVKATLYPALNIATDDEVAAVNRLLDFVQTAFAYRDDQSQFGSERPLYPEETLFSPYSDCDDRAILFASLVDELTGLETIFLNYHDHLAVGVRFNDPVPGETVESGGKTYTICDPTFIGAGVGKTTTKVRDVMPGVTPALSQKK